MLEGGHRRSARLYALEASRAQQASTSGGGPEEARKRAAEELDDDSEIELPEVPERNRGRKKRKLRTIDEVVVNSVETVAQEASSIPNNEDHTSNTVQPPTLLPASEMPQKRLLELFLDVMKKRDSHQIFAQPVDPEEVKGYYEVIKQPMDFATMTAKLEGGMYTTLEQFENDIFMIAGNAMHFNSSNTIYFRQARAIYELAKKMFQFLRSDPENFELEYSVDRQRPGRKPGNGTGSQDKVSTNVKPNGKSIDSAPNHRPFSINGSSGLRRSAHPRVSNSLPLRNRRNYEILSGLGGDNLRGINRPWTSFLNENEAIASKFYDRSEPLMLVNQRDIRYEESLMRFAKDLGPIAQMVARRKLQSLQALTQILPTSVQQRSTPPNSIINIPPSQNFLERNSTGYGTVLTNNGNGIYNTIQQNQSSAFQLGSHFPIAHVGDLNIPASGMANPGNGDLAMMNLSGNPAPLVELVSEFPQTRMLQLASRNVNSSRSTPSPIQGMRATSLNRAIGPIYNMSSHSFGRRSPEMTISGPSYIVNSGQSAGLVSETLGSHGSHILEGQDQAMAALHPIYGASSNLLAHVLGWSESNLNSYSVGGQNNTINAPEPSNVVNSVQEGPVPEWSRPNFTSLFFNGDEIMGAPGLGYGVSSAQADPAPEWSQHRPCNTQAVLNMAFLEMRLREMNSLNRNESVQSDLQISLTPEVSSFAPMGFYERDRMHSHQAEQSTLAFLNNQQPDLDLQL